MTIQKTEPTVAGRLLVEGSGDSSKSEILDSSQFRSRDWANLGRRVSAGERLPPLIIAAIQTQSIDSVTRAVRQQKERLHRVLAGGSELEISRLVEAINDFLVGVGWFVLERSADEVDPDGIEFQELKELRDLVSGVKGRLILATIPSSFEFETETFIRRLENADEQVREAYQTLDQVCERLNSLGWSDASIYVLDSLNDTLERMVSSPHAGLRVRSLGAANVCDQEAWVFAQGNVEIHRFASARPRSRYDQSLYRLENHSRFKTRLFAAIGVVMAKGAVAGSDGHVRWKRCNGEEVQDTVMHRLLPEGYSFEALGTLSLSSEETMSRQDIDATVGYLDEVGRLVHHAKLRRLAIVGHEVLCNALGVTGGYLLLSPERNVHKLLESEEKVELIAYHGLAGRAAREVWRSDGLESAEAETMWQGCVELLASGARAKQVELKDVRVGSVDSSRGLLIAQLEHGLGFFCAFDAEPKRLGLLKHLVSRLSHILAMSLDALERRRVRLRKIFLQEQGHGLNGLPSAYEARLADAVLGTFGADLVTVIGLENGSAQAGFVLSSEQRYRDGARALVDRVLLGHWDRESLHHTQDSQVIVQLEAGTSERGGFLTTVVAACRHTGTGLVIDFRREFGVGRKEIEQMSIFLGLASSRAKDCSRSIERLEKVGVDAERRRTAHRSWPGWGLQTCSGLN